MLPRCSILSSNWLVASIRPTPRKRTVVWESERWWQERRVAFDVEIEMSLRGKQRDKNLRAALTREACEFWGTDPAAVGRFLKHNPIRIPSESQSEPRRRLSLRREAR